MRSEICVIGGGPSGLAAAIALTQSGREVTLLDRAVPPIDKACGEGLLPDSLDALGLLGVTVPAGSARLDGIKFIGADSEVCADFPNGVGRGVRRVLLHEQLVTRAEQLGVRLLWGVKNVQTSLGTVNFQGGEIRTRLIVGADGQRSAVRQQAQLDELKKESCRFGFRRHYSIEPWSSYVEVYWGNGFQIYTTPVTHDQVCLAVVSANPHLRLTDALAQCPVLSERLGQAHALTSEAGSLSASRTLKRVHCEGYVLVGDASGSVDAITGEGMCLAFKQTDALVQALNAGNMRIFARAHKKIAFKPALMASLLLMLSNHPNLQRRVLPALAAHPGIFARLLAMHVGQRNLTNMVSSDLFRFALGILSA